MNTDDLVLMGVDAGPRPGVATKVGGRYLTVTCESMSEALVMIQDTMPAALGLELFARSNRIDSNMIATMESVGSIKATCILLNIPCFTARPQQRKSYILDAKPLLPAGASPHERDALAHLLFLEDKIKDGRIKL